MDERLRSVLSHPLGLPLVSMLNGQDPGSLPFLALQSMPQNENAKTTNPSTKFDTIFSSAVREWVLPNEGSTPRTETQLTKLLSKKIQTQSNFDSDSEVLIGAATVDKEQCKGRIDILLTPRRDGVDSTDGVNSTDGVDSTKSSTPLALFEVGRNDSDWWKEIDQNIKYVDRLGRQQGDKRLRFEKPLLCVVLTIADEEEKCIKVKLGVFLCAPKDTNGARNDFRLSLLWYFSANDREEASKGFGKLLRATSTFSRWRESPGEHDSSFEYFSSNCSRVGEQVSGVRIPMTSIRLYDTQLTYCTTHSLAPRWQVLRS